MPCIQRPSKGVPYYQGNLVPSSPSPVTSLSCDGGVAGLKRRSSGLKQALVMERVQGCDIWAVIVGIDNYESASFHPLRGCQNDVDDVCQYLKDNLQVPESNVLVLRDAKATRSAILQSLERHFIDNTRFTERSIVIFYFAGHGARVDVGSTDDDIRVVASICPYDAETVVPGVGTIHSIPQPTLQAWFDLLERQKRCHAIVVLDSCYSGGMFTDTQHGNSQVDSLRSTADLAPTVRGPGTFLPFSNPSLPDNVDSDLAVRHAGLVEVTMTSPSSDKSCTYRSAREHAYVVLAACDQHQIAHEVRDADGKLRGAFTLALFRALRDSEDGRKSYHTIISNLKLVRPSVTGQQPECRGMDRFKRAFMHYAVQEEFSSNSQEMENGQFGAYSGQEQMQSACAAFRRVDRTHTRRQRLPARESTPALPRLRRLQTSDAHMRLPISESMAAVK